MRLIFFILSIAYIAVTFLLADTPMVSDLSAFNPYSLLHIPFYGILTFLLIFSFFPFNFKTNVPNVLNDPNVTNGRNASAHPRLNTSARLRFLISGFIASMVAIADEIHQSFIPTRDASILDVFLDFIGIVLTLFLLSKLYKERIRSMT